MIENKQRCPLCLLLFAIGALIGMAFNGQAVFGDIEADAFWGPPQEAIYYSPSLDTATRFVHLSCPAIITAGEIGTVGATFKNPTKDPVKPIIRAYMSHEIVTQYRDITYQTQIDPGKSQTLHWVVTPEDSIKQGFILVRVLLYEVYPSASRTMSCSILYLPINLDGRLVTGLIIASSLLAMFAGIRLWMKKGGPIRENTRLITSGMIVLAGAILVEMVINFIGLFLVSGIVYLVTVLISVGILGDIIRST